MAVLPSVGTSLGTGWGSFLKKMTLEGENAAELLARQVRFRTTREGATTVAHVLPDSARARELWELDSTKRFVQGVLDLANEVSGSEHLPLRGFSLSTSELGYVMNRATHHMRPGVAPSRRAFQAGIVAAQAHVDNTAAVRKGAWLHLDPARSRGLLYMLDHPDVTLPALPTKVRESLGRGVKTLLHELNHVGSPRTGGKSLAWLSEGSAETLARWPGRVKRAGDVLEVDAPARVGKWFDDAGAPYQEEVDAVRALLRMCGINPSRADDFSKAEALLNGVPEHLLPRTLANIVAERHTTTPAEARALRKQIRLLIEHGIAPDGEHANARSIQSLARKLSARHQG